MTIKGTILEVSKLVTAIGVILTLVGTLGKPHLDKYLHRNNIEFSNSVYFKSKVDSLNIQFINSPNFSLFVDGVIKDYEKQLAEEESNKVGLRTLLSLKMGVDEDEVHIKLGEMFKSEEEFKKKIITYINEIIEEVKREHPSNTIKTKQSW